MTLQETLILDQRSVLSSGVSALPRIPVHGERPGRGQGRDTGVCMGSMQQGGPTSHCHRAALTVLLDPCPLNRIKKLFFK